MKKLKLYLSAASLVAASLAASTSAQAGEITGTGSFTPVHSYQASSICSFSGLNDTPEDGTGFVQVFSYWMKLLGILPGDDLHPGQSCRGN